LKASELLPKDFLYRYRRMQESSLLTQSSIGTLALLHHSLIDKLENTLQLTFVFKKLFPYNQHTNDYLQSKGRNLKRFARPKGKPEGLANEE